MNRDTPAGPGVIEHNREIYRSNPCRATSYLEKDCIVVSCGVENFEWGNFSNRSCYSCKGHLDQLYEGRYKNGLLRDRLFKDMFLRSFKRNYPRLCEDREIIVIDCNQFHDPEKDKDRSLKEHRGTHWKIQAGVLSDRNFNRIMDPLKEFNNIPGKKLIICVCRSGRHRSEATRPMVHTTLCYDYYLSLIHI